MHAIALHRVTWVRCAIQAVSIGHQGKWDTGIGADGYPHYSDPDGTLSTARLRMFMPLQQWLLRHGDGLLQLQCSTAFTTAVSWRCHCAATPASS